MAHSPKNAFFWWPDKNCVGLSPSEVLLNLRRWHVDLKATDLTLPADEIRLHENLEFARIDDLVATMKHHAVFFCLMNPTAGTDFTFVMPRMVNSRLKIHFPIVKTSSKSSSPLLLAFAPTHAFYPGRRPPNFQWFRDVQWSKAHIREILRRRVFHPPKQDCGGRGWLGHVLAE